MTGDPLLDALLSHVLVFFGVVAVFELALVWAALLAGSGAVDGGDEW